MFIKMNRVKNSLVYEISDDRGLLLHYFDKEIEALTLQSPLYMFIIISENDRIGFRKKLYKIFKKVNKLNNYFVEIGTIDKITLTIKELERKII